MSKYVSDDDSLWELALATNAAFKGLLGSLGQSGHICASTEAIQVSLNLETGWRNIQQIIAAEIAEKIQDGDVITVAEKVVAASQKRIGPREVLNNPDPKTITLEQLENLAAVWQDKLGFIVKPIHLLLADEYSSNQSTLGVWITTKHAENSQPQ